jgi:hypothetical protein
MFELTRREQALLAGIMAAFLVGLGVKHWRDCRSFPQTPASSAARH